MVDELIGKQEVVIKSLGNAFRNVAGVSGGAILGDGRVGLIVDLQTLFGGSHDV
jgi:two-component system chemotaxis sensor kinase CheA